MMSLHDEASPLTPESRKRLDQVLGLPESDDTPAEVCEVDDLIREAMDADDVRAWEEGLDDPAVLAQRFDTLKGWVWGQEARIRKLEGRLNETTAMDTERGTLTQRIQSLERNFESFRKFHTDKAKRAEQELARDLAPDPFMDSWGYRSLAKAREGVIDAMLEGGERFERMSPIHIHAYGNSLLDCPPFEQDIERPNFIVLDVLPEVLRQAFMERFTPVASLLRDGAEPPLSLGRFEDWQAFSKTFA